MTMYEKTEQFFLFYSNLLNCQSFNYIFENVNSKSFKKNDKNSL